jgi:hypothetical protein
MDAHDDALRTKKGRMRIPNEQGDLGRFDAESEALQKRLNAVGVAIVVIEGSSGSGFSISIHSDPLALDALARTFELVAKQIRSELL